MKKTAIERLEELGLGFKPYVAGGDVDPRFANDHEDADCDCMEDEEETEAKVELELPPLRVASPRIEVEIEFTDRDDIKVGGLYTDAVDTIYIEDDEIRLVDGPIAQVISLDDIKFLRANIR